MRLPFWACLAVGATALVPRFGPGGGAAAARRDVTRPSASPSPSSLPTSDAASVVASLPSCAMPCVADAIANSTCSGSDLACLCADDGLMHAAGTCVQAECSLSDALSAKNTTQTACHAPVRDRSAAFTRTVIALGVVTIVITVARLVFKKFFHPSNNFGSDDWAISATLAICIAGLVIGLQGMTPNGLGRDVWTLTTTEISQFVLYFYVSEILYLAGISLVKLSISLFYLHLFSTIVAPAVLWATVIFNLLYGVIFVTGAIFQCTPVDFYWMQYLDATDGHCININLFGWLNAAIGLIIDIWMLILPMSQVLPLKLHWKKKVGVAIMFLLGAFVTVVSGLRMGSLIHFAKSDNPTWDSWTTAYWSIIEVNVAMICSCLPTLRLILVRIFPRIFGASKSSTYPLERGSAAADVRRGENLPADDGAESPRCVKDVDET